MNEFTLRFYNSVLEEQFRQSKVMPFSKYFLFCQVQMLVVGFSYLFFLISKGTEPNILIAASMFLGMITFLAFIGFVKRNDYIPYIMLFENILVCLVEIQFFQDVQNILELYQDWMTQSHASYVMGFFFGVTNSALIMNPDYVKCLMQIFSIVLLKITICILAGYPFFILVVLIAGCSLAFQVYCKVIACRECFLSLQQYKGQEYILNKGFTDCFVQCQVDLNHQELNYVRSNENFQEKFSTNCSTEMRALFRSITVILENRDTQTLEQWLWNKGVSCVQNDQSASIFKTEGVIECKLDEVLSKGSKSNFSVMVLMTNLVTLEYLLFFRDDSHFSVQLKQIQQLKSELQRFKLAVLKQARIALNILTFSRSLISTKSAQRDDIQQVIALKGLQVNCFHLSQIIFESQMIQVYSYQIRACKLKNILEQVNNFYLTKNNHQTFFLAGQNELIVAKISLIVHIHLMVLRFIQQYRKGFLSIYILDVISHEKKIGYLQIKYNFLLRKDNPVDIQKKLDQLELKTRNILSMIGYHKKLTINYHDKESAQVAFSLLTQNHDQEKIL